MMDDRQMNRLLHGDIAQLILELEQRYANNTKDTEARVAKEAEAKLAPRLQEYETKVKDYETRLEQVQRFEHVLENDAQTTLKMLAEHPTYKPFFDYVRQLEAGAAGTKNTPADPYGDMPMPDSPLADGTMVYSLEGLKARDAWQAKQIEDRISKQFEQRYAPIEQDYRAQRQLAEMKPKIEKMISEARTWTLFSENEDEITQVLQSNPSISLEGAYRQVVIPKLVADRSKMKEQVIGEIRKAPASTAVPTRASKPVAEQGPRSIEAIISAEIEANRDKFV